MATKRQWTDDEFVEMWRERPCLFDTSLKAYSNSNSRRAALEEMSLRLGKTVNDICKKMKNMRTQFNRISKARASGSGRGLTQHQSWILKNLKFLLPYTLRRETQSSFKLESNTQDDEDEENALSFDDEITQTRASPTPSNSSWNAELQALSSTPTCSESDPPNPPATKKRVNPGPKERAVDRLNREKMAVLKRIAESIEKPLSLPDMEEERMDEDDCFGQFVASQLRSIKDQRTKTRVMAALSNTLFAELSNLDTMPNFPTQPP